MTPARTGAARRILLLTDTLGGFSAPVGGVLRRRFSAMHPRAEVTEVDFFEEFVPGIAVLAKLAYTQDAAFAPESSLWLEPSLAAAPENQVLRALAAGGIDRLGAFIGSNRFDAILATSNVAAAATAELTSASRPPVAAVLAGFSAKGNWIHPGCDLYFVATKEVREDLVMAGVPYTRVIVSGIPGAVPEDRRPQRVLRAQAGIADRFTVVLGGAGNTQADVKLIATALASHGIQVIVVPGRDGRLVRQFEALSASNPLISVVESTAEMSAEMLGDVVMARAGGAVLLQAVCAGVPSVIYNRVAEQEWGNVDFLLNAGVSLLARDDEDAIDKARYLSSHPDRLAQMTASAKASGRSDATRLVVDRVTAMVR